MNEEPTYSIVPVFGPVQDGDLIYGTLNGSPVILSYKAFTASDMSEERGYAISVVLRPVVGSQPSFNIPSERKIDI